MRSDVNRAIWRLFRENGITIPRAQMDLRLVDATGRVQTLEPVARPPHDDA